MSVNPSPREAGSVTASGDQAPSSVKHRPSWIAFVVLGAIFCLGMGVWQLSRYQEASGTVQNLGYTFMWPFLAGFLVYAYLKYVRLEADEADRVADASGSAADAGVAGLGSGTGAGPGTGVGAGGLAAGGDKNHDDDNTAHTVPQSPHTGSGSRPGSSRVSPAGRGRRRGPVVTEIPADLLPTRRPTIDAEARDEGLAAYNSYLADLDRKNRGATGDHQERPAS